MGACQNVCTNQSQSDRRDLDQSIKIQYNGEKFIMPERICFDKQTTYTKVEQAAREFCEVNKISAFYTPLLTRIIAYRHEFVFQEIWNRLSQSGRQQFLEDLSSIQHDLMDSFYHHFVERKMQMKRIALKLPSITAPKLIKEADIEIKEREELRKIGEDLLINNKVAAVFLCAGSSSRFQGHDKFLAPISLYENVTILDINFKRLFKNSRGNKQMPILISCNEFNKQKIEEHIKRKNYYGFNSRKFRFYITYSLAVFDDQGKYSISDKMKLMKRSSGTASSAEELLNFDIDSYLKSEGVQYVYFSGMQNLLQNPCDTLLLGMIKAQKKKIAAKCVNPSFINQNLTRYFKNQQTNSIQVLNSQDFKRLQSGTILNNLPVAINSMVFELESLKQIIGSYSSSLFLAEKYHVIVKEQNIYNVNQRKIQSQTCYSFEKDMRDIITCVDDPLLLKVSRSKGYVPIYSKDKQYALSEALNHYETQLSDELRGMSGGS